MRFLSTILSFILLGCQLSPKWTESLNHSEDIGVSRFYLHYIPDNRRSSASDQQRIIIDKSEVTNLKDLDKDGVLQEPGKHEVKFVNGSLDVSEMSYYLRRHHNTHLYLCESDGSFHFISNLQKAEDPQSVLHNRSRLCDP